MAMRTFINTADDIAWLREQHLKGAELPKPWNEFKFAILQGNEDAPHAVNLYLAADPAFTDDYLRVTFADDCSIALMQPHDGKTDKVIRAETGAPNLDDCTRDDALNFWARVQFHPVRTARELFPERPAGYVAATKELSRYASNIATAKLCRQLGDTHRATMYEGIAQRIYDRLPTFARW